VAVPSNRVPVRVARGLKSALTANLADLLEGELLYAKDEDKLYMVEGGALVAMGADLAASSVGDLTDVTLTSAAVGEVLRYDGSAWVDAQLDYSDLSGTPTLGTAAASDTTDFATAAQGALADSAVQSTDSIDSLADVDTTTAAPTNGQVLEWDGSNWVPATLAAGGVTSIVAGTGISVDQATGDVTITATGGGGGVPGNISYGMVMTKVVDGSPSPASGGMSLWHSSTFGFSTTDNRGIDFETELYAASNADVKVYYQNNLTYNGTTSSWGNKNSSRITISFADASWWAAIPEGASVEVWFDGVTEGKTIATNPGDFVLADPYGTARVQPPPFIDALANVDTSGAVDGDFLAFSSADGGWVDTTPQIYQNSNVGKALTAYGEYQYSTTPTSAPATGLITNYGSTSWAANVVDFNGVDFEDAIYSLPSTQISAEVFVNGVSVYVGTVGGWSNTNSSRYTFTFGNDSWKSALVNNDIIRIVATAYQTTDMDEVDGQILTWSNSRSMWEPADAAGGGAVDSVNGQTGVVALDLADLTDVLDVPAEYGTWDTVDGGSIAAYTDGDFYAAGGDTLYLAANDANGVSFLSAAGGTEYWYSYDATNWTHITGATISVFSGQLSLSPRTGTSNTAPTYVAFTDPEQSNPEFLKYDRTNSQYQAAQIGVDDMSDVDTTTAAPTDGQVLTWVDANGQWEPADAAGGGGDPLFSFVTVLAPFDSETNGATTWTTYGSTSPTWTAGGGSISNSETRWGGTTSLNVTGTATTIPCSLGTNDWTIEEWVWLDQSTWNNFGAIFKNGLLTDTFDVFYAGPNGSASSARFRISNSGSTLITISGNCSWEGDQWNHVAICRAGDVYSMYVNGEKVGSGTQAGRTFDSGNISVEASEGTTGYVQDFRVSVGVARYSTAFYPVPSSPLPTS